MGELQLLAKENHTDKADNLGANDHDTKDGFFVIKDGEETGIRLQSH